jgi:4-oxalocrotonate tautomerase
VPTITVDLFKGRSLDQKRTLGKKITDVVCEVVNCPASAVNIRIVEGDRENYASGGVLYSDKG